MTGLASFAGRFVQRLRQETAAVPTVTLRQGVVKRLLDGLVPPLPSHHCLPVHSSPRVTIMSLA